MPYRKNPLTLEELRLQAKTRLMKHGVGQGKALTPDEVQHLVEELEIHRIELELQNEHLNGARAQLEAALNQSNELYDFSPVGSLSLDSTGTITKLNLSAARLLGGERARLLGTKLGLYVSDADRPLFNALMERATKSDEVQSSEMTLVSKEFLVQYVNVRVAAFQPEIGWHVVLVDINQRRLHEQQLRASEERWKLALDVTGDGVWDWHVPTGEAVFSKRFEQLYGFDEHTYGSRVEDWSARVHPDDKARALADLHDYLNGVTATYSSEHRGQCRDGSWKWVLARGAIVSHTPEGGPLRVIGTHIDITNRKELEQALLDATRFQQSVFDALDAQILVLDHEGTIMQTNSAWRKYALAAGYAQTASFQGGNYLEILDRITARDQATVLAVSAGIASVLSGSAPGFKLPKPFFAPLEKAWFNMKATGVQDGGGRVVVSHEDVSDLKAAELASLVLANTDALTGALSRRNFLNLAEQELARSLRYQLPLMVLMLDLDHFKCINDKHGHAVGDAVLQRFVHTVQAVLRDSDMIGRLGGEEFAVLLPNTAVEGGRALAQRIIDSVRSSRVQANDQQIAYTVSAGAACFSDQRSFIDLLKVADAALYCAKENGRDCVEVGSTWPAAPASAPRG